MTDHRPAAAHPLRGLLVAQFFGAFNDNALKVTVALLAMRNLVAPAGSPATEAAAQARTTLAFVALTAGLMVASLPAGLLADRVSKRSVILGMKALEVVLMAAVTGALLLVPDNRLLPLAVLVMMGAQSALFGPAKYGILPEILPHEEISKGNGLLEMWTMLAIIAGIAAAGPLLDLTAARPWMAGILFTLLAVAGLVAAIGVPRVPPARSQGGLAETLRSAWSAIRSDGVLRLAIFGSIYLWTVASLLGQDILVYAKATLGLSDTLSGLPLAVLGAGIGVGSLLAGRLSAGKVEYGLIPLGAVGMAVVTFGLGLFGPGLAATLVLMALLGAAGGLILVPINSLIQWRAPADRRGGVIAVANLFVYTGILVGSLAAGVLGRVGLSPRAILVVVAVAVAGGTIWALRLLPDAFLRLGLLLVTHTIYRLTVVNRQRVPQPGGALLVPNHVSFVDGLLLLASVDRPVRFVVESSYFHYPPLRPFMVSLGAIPISAAEGPRVLLRALRQAGRYLDEGEVVCVFPEGQITRTGMLLPFRRGFERIVAGRNAPIVPVNLDRVWGSIFSRSGGRFITKLPRRLPYPVTVSFGEPLPPGEPIHRVRAAVRELGTSAWELRKAGCGPLYKAFVRKARLRPWRLAMADAKRPGVSRLGALAGAIAFARALRPYWQHQKRVGILLPSGVGGALTNLAVALAGRVSVNLNYTAGAEGMSSAARQAGLRTVITSRTFLTKARLELPEGVEPVWIEEVVSGMGRARRLAALLLALLAPLRLLERACGSLGRPDADDVATIIFSSGSTGEPKGVELTHFNIDSNVEGAAQVIQSSRHDRLLGILPFFHSFGYMATIWLALNNGMGVVYHANPLDAGAIGGLVQQYRLTIMIATPTFLQLYIRRCTPAQFGSLRLVIAGAEKLNERLVGAFEDHFGIGVLEGYGATECSPVVALNVPDFRAPGYYQPGTRRGTVGQPLPGVAVRIADVDTFEPLPPGEEGMILVKGPNVMRGYLGRDDLTERVMHDGWYVTGDIGTTDEDGFLRITDRLARFSKIGGEMVPHGVVEEALQEAAGIEDRVFAVTAVADERKGERLAVVHTLDEQQLPAILEKLSASGLPNLYLPRRDDFVKVDELPVLGTGKSDLRAVKQLARQALQR
ncbi:MAG: acyl-[ACP]--phospholipid O-acyltransferase [Acidobacteriota bacterium]